LTSPLGDSYTRDRGNKIKTIQPLNQPQSSEEPRGTIDADVEAPVIRESFSDTPVYSINEHEDRFVHTARQPIDHTKPSAYEIAQLPKMVYVIAIVSLLSAVISFIFAYNSLSFVIAILNFFIAIGLLLRFNLARKITIGLALFSVIISIIVLTQIANFKNQATKAYTQLHQTYNNSFVANNDPIAQSTGGQQLYSETLNTVYSNKLKSINKMRGTAIWTAIICSGEALYFFSPRVKAAYES
jgi:hypothetical protein